MSLYFYRDDKNTFSKMVQNMQIYVAFLFYHRYVFNAIDCLKNVTSFSEHNLSLLSFFEHNPLDKSVKSSFLYTRK